VTINEDPRGRQGGVSRGLEGIDALGGVGTRLDGTRRSPHGGEREEEKVAIHEATGSTEWEKVQKCQGVCFTEEEKKGERRKKGENKKRKKEREREKEEERGESLKGGQKIPQVAHSCSFPVTNERRKA